MIGKSGFKNLGRLVAKNSKKIVNLNLVVGVVTTALLSGYLIGCNKEKSK